MSYEPPNGELPRRVALIGTAILTMVALIVGVHAAEPHRRGEAPAFPEARYVTVPSEPVQSEAQVFRTRADVVAVGMDAERRTTAHPRTLATFRALRAYPGAPPRIPHGLTRDEFRLAKCRTCHERGGFAERFGAYAPITPHPELSDCLQCHVPDASVVGVALPDENPNALCHQCHASPALQTTETRLDWQPAPWPATGQSALEGSPPPIPHDLDLRGNCLACHAGPGAVEEIRTQHPERGNCRQCHVAAGDEAPYVRPIAGYEQGQGHGLDQGKGKGQGVDVNGRDEAGARNGKGVAASGGVR